MNDLLNHPAVQAGVIPFLVGLAGAFALARTRFLAAVPWAAFIAVVALVLGFSLEPMTAVRKLVVIGLAGGVVALVLEASPLRPTSPLVRAALAALAAAASLWMLSRVLGQREGGALWGAAAGVALYGAAVTASLLWLAGDTLRSSVAMTVVGVASGALALLSASASMAQIGIALGAASGALVLTALLRGRRAAPGWFLALPVSLVCGAIGTGSAMTGDGPWLALLPVPLIAVAARLARVADDRPVWVAAVVSGLAALVPAGLAVALAWLRIGAPPA